MTKAKKPASRPQKNSTELRTLLQSKLTLEELKLLDKYQVKFIGVRGYYMDTLGKPGENDRGMYDDAIFLIGPNYFKSFNANTDPSKFQSTIAVLKPGTYIYKPGPHGISGKNPYPAFRQHGPVVVLRDGIGEDTDEGKDRFYINIHKGGYSTTSSLGCQTIYPDQWLEAQRDGYDLLELHDQTEIPYALIEI
jgi:lysozyme